MSKKCEYREKFSVRPLAFTLTIRKNKYGGYLINTRQTGRSFTIHYHSGKTTREALIYAYLRLLRNDTPFGMVVFTRRQYHAYEKIMEQIESKIIQMAMK